MTTRNAGRHAGRVCCLDLAAESGGNVEGVVAGRDLQVPVDGGSVTLVGLQDAASAMPSDASRLFARNVGNLLALMTADGTVVPDFDDDVVAGACLTHGGCRRGMPPPRQPWRAPGRTHDGPDHAC